MSEIELTVKLPGVDAASASRKIQELEGDLRQARSQGLDAHRRREPSEAMDFGATLGIILGAPAVITLAKALVVWARRTNTVRLEVSNARGNRVVLENVDSKSVADVVAAIAPLVAAQEGTGGKA